MDLIPNDWKHLLRTKTSKKPLLETFYYNTKDTGKVKEFQKLSNKEIYFINTTNLSNSYHGQTFLKDIIF